MNRLSIYPLWTIGIVVLLVWTLHVAWGQTGPRSTPDPVPRVLQRARSVQTPAADQPAPIDTVLQQWIARIRTVHPRLRSIARQIEAQTRRVRPAGQLPDPMLMVTVQNEGSPLPFESIGSDMMSFAGIQIQQTIPWKGKLRYRKEIATALQRRLEARYARAYWEIVAGLSRTAAELAFVHTQLEILDESRTLLDQLIAIAEALYSVGRGTQSDVLRAYTERSKLDERIALMDQRLHTLQRIILEQYLTQPDAILPALRLSESIPPLPEETTLLDAVERAPVLQELHALRTWQRFRARLARLAVYPDITIQAGWFSRGSLPDLYRVGIGINIPLFAGAKQIPLYEAEETEITAIERRIEDTRYELRWRVQDVVLRASTAKRIIDLYRMEILPQAQADFESALDNYQTGRLDFLNVMDRWLRWLNFRIEYQRQLANYYQALADLSGTLGNPYWPSVPAASSTTRASLPGPSPVAHSGNRLSGGQP